MATAKTRKAPAPKSPPAPEPIPLARPYPFGRAVGHLVEWTAQACNDARKARADLAARAADYRNNRPDDLARGVARVAEAEARLGVFRSALRWLTPEEDGRPAAEVLATARRMAVKEAMGLAKWGVEESSNHLTSALTTGTLRAKASAWELVLGALDAPEGFGLEDDRADWPAARHADLDALEAVCRGDASLRVRHYDLAAPFLCPGAEG